MPLGPSSSKLVGSLIMKNLGLYIFFVVVVCVWGSYFLLLKPHSMRGMYSGSHYPPHQCLLAEHLELSVFFRLPFFIPEKSKTTRLR